MPFDGAGFVPGKYLQQIDEIIDLLQTPGRWGKGSLRTPDGRYCLRGAIRSVDGGEALRPVILNAINEVTGRHCWQIESFNDNPRTDHEQIMAVLIRARDNIAAGRTVTDPNGTTQHSCWTRWSNGVRSWFRK